MDKDPLVSWKRWKKKVINDQIRTVNGAERYIKSGRSIFLDTALKIPFPINIDVEKITVHKIIIAHGAKEACEKISDDNVYGSLAISYGSRDTQFPSPFKVDLDKEKPVHVFDSYNLPIIFNELDTIYDFSSYLEAKLDAIKSLDALVYCGEEDLLAHYYRNFDESKNNHFIGTIGNDTNFVMIGEGEWRDFIKSQFYKNKKSADKVSYLWDEIIQSISQHTLDDTLLGDSSPLKGQSAIHEMAKEPRFARRNLSEGIKQSIQNFLESPKSSRLNLSFYSSFYHGKGYVFLQLKVDDVTDYENDYRLKLKELLEIACGVIKNKYGYLDTIIGIATVDALNLSKKSLKDLIFILMDCSAWSDDLRKHYEQYNEDIGFLKSANLTIQKIRVSEFPLIEKNK